MTHFRAVARSCYTTSLAHPHALDTLRIVSEYACDSRPADVAFVLDSSNSIWLPDFRKQLQFVSDVIDFFPISPDMIRVSVVTFSSYPSVHFNFNR